MLQKFEANHKGEFLKQRYPKAEKSHEPSLEAVDAGQARVQALLPFQKARRKAAVENTQLLRNELALQGWVLLDQELHLSAEMQVSQILQGGASRAPLPPMPSHGGEVRWLWRDSEERSIQEA